MANMTQVSRSADFSVSAGNRKIVARFRNPSRVAAIEISNEPWEKLAQVPAQYRPMIDAILESTAKAVLSQYLESFSTWPTTINADLFTNDALIDAATSSNSTWLSKEQLTDLWKASATRKGFYADERYSNSGAYRKAVAKFEELVLKLAGKSAKIESDDLDKILVKLNDNDLETELGSFIVKRIEALKAKPQSDTIDLDCL